MTAADGDGLDGDKVDDDGEGGSPTVQKLHLTYRPGTACLTGTFEVGKPM